MDFITLATIDGKKISAPFGTVDCHGCDFFSFDFDLKQPTCKLPQENIDNLMELAKYCNVASYCVSVFNKKTQRYESYREYIKREEQC